MKQITVAAGIILDSEGKILVTKRPMGKPSAGLWEFPGGKVEPNELPEQALCRELQEELAIMPTEFSFYLELNFTYPDRHVLLYIFKVHKFSGTPKGLEQQELQWIKIADLMNYSFLEANKSIIQKLIQDDAQLNKA